jgi:hypothetical protein
MSEGQWKVQNANANLEFLTFTFHFSLFTFHLPFLLEVWA